MNILSQILRNKRNEVDERKQLYPIKLLEKSIYFNTDTVSLKKYLVLSDKSGIIAEFKTKSPSKGDINPYADVSKISIEYMQAGASALSILTDQKFFGGKTEHITQARKYNYCPILQKDFFIDEYQVIEAKSIGADAILLIANALSKSKLRSMTMLANSLDLEVLFEVHNKQDLGKMNELIEIVGVNNRNLETFQTDIQQSVEMADEIPNELIKVSESGISNASDINLLRSYGFNGFLIGENFMKTSNPGRACKDIISDLTKNVSNDKLKEITYETESLRVK